MPDRRRGRAARTLVLLPGPGSGDPGDDVLRVRLVPVQVRHHPAAAEDDDPVHQAEDLPHVVADEDQRFILLSERPDDVLDLCGLLHPERGRRLVHDGDVLAPAEDEVRALEGADPAVVFGEVPGLHDDVARDAMLSAAHPSGTFRYAPPHAAAATGRARPRRR